MLTVTEGIEKAKEHLTLILPEIYGNLQLEELETPPFGSTWSFTFSGLSMVPDGRPTLSQLIGTRRVAKSVQIDSQTGDLLSVKNVAA